MKSTNTSNSVAKQRQILKHRVLVFFACLGLAVLWFCILSLITILVSKLTENMGEMSPAVYSWIQVMFGPILMATAALLVIPFAVVIFKRLQVMRPALSAIALPLSFLFAFCLFGVLLDSVPFLWYYNQWAIWGLALFSMIVSLAVYWLIVRKLARRLSRLWLIVIMLALPIVTLVLDILFRLSVNFL